MSVEITMPKLSETMEEGTVLEWRIQPGDRVQKGDVIAEVETDKAAMEMEVFADGVVDEIHVLAGETVAVGAVIAIFQLQDRVQTSNPQVSQSTGWNRTSKARKRSLLLAKITIQTQRLRQSALWFHRLCVNGLKILVSILKACVVPARVAELCWRTWSVRPELSPYL